MTLLALVILVCFLIHTYNSEKMKRKIAYTMHIQERTEEAETLDFAVHLFEDETVQDWSFKLERAYSIAEARRGFNNKRMEDAYLQAKKNAEEAKNITPLKKV